MEGKDVRGRIYISEQVQPPVPLPGLLSAGTWLALQPPQCCRTACLATSPVPPPGYCRSRLVFCRAGRQRRLLPRRPCVWRRCHCLALLFSCPLAAPTLLAIPCNPPPQGINAQYGGVKEDAVGYAQWLEQQPMFEVRPHGDFYCWATHACSWLWTGMRSNARAGGPGRGSVGGRTSGALAPRPGASQGLQQARAAAMGPLAAAHAGLFPTGRAPHTPQCMFSRRHSSPSGRPRARRPGCPPPAGSDAAAACLVNFFLLVILCTAEPACTWLALPHTPPPCHPAPTCILPQGLFYTVWPVQEHMYPR